MIPRDYVTAWRATAPWVEDAQVEQDLVISRALVEMFSHPLLARCLSFRGGTALYKLYLTPAARYSEDIDLVQVEAGPAGAVMDAIQATLNPWLGKPRWKQTRGRVTFRYGFESGGPPSMRMRLKVEINTREHVAVLGHVRRLFSVRSRWFERAASIRTFELDELLATKLRALYQRKKGRDLFDLMVGLGDGRSDSQRIAQTFRSYMELEKRPVTRAMFEQNLDAKLRDPGFGSDMSGLLAAGRKWDAVAAAGVVAEALLSRLPGEAWQGRKLETGTSAPARSGGGASPRHD
ncbi:MAG: nucleotidyl transferase AbiEii/AbiGii toxin family protein [Gammaproteobacteria bacterium]|nr:nucleotidyl transferase AbiEii/AbiGii toxin family protein [Gammaproteobacteria bacterium]